MTDSHSFAEALRRQLHRVRARRIPDHGAPHRARLTDVAQRRCPRLENHVEHLAGNLTEESRCLGKLRGPIGVAAERVQQVEAAAGAGDAHVGQPSLFGDPRIAFLQRA